MLGHVEAANRRQVMKARIATLAGLCLLLFSARLPASAQERIELPTRPGVTEPVYITMAEEPKASVILFPGHGGAVAYARETDNFLLRVAARFVAHDMTVAMIGSPPLIMPTACLPHSGPLPIMPRTSLPQQRC
jgi:hypothetical protein